MKVVCLMAQTLDGKIAKNKTDFIDWTEPADKKLFRSKTKEAGVMIFGRTTFETLPGVLPGRLSIVMSRSVGAWEERADDLVFTSKSPVEVIAHLRSLEYETIVVAGGETINSLFAKEGLLDELWITISPLVFGEGLGIFQSGLEMDLQLKTLEKLGDNSMFAEYKVLK